MWLSIIWLCAALVFGLNWHPLTALFFLDVYLVHRLWEIKKYPKRRKFF